MSTRTELTEVTASECQFPDRLLWNIEETARQLGGVSTKTVYRMLERGELPRVKIGRAVRIPARAVRAWVARQVELSHNGSRVGLGVRQQEVNVCHINANAAAIGGSLTPTQAVKELDVLLEQTDRKEAEALEARWKLESFRAQQWDDEPSRTFDEMMLAYLQETREKTSHQRDLNAAVHLHAHFAGCELNRLRASDIRAYVETRKPVVKPATVNRELGLLSAAINYARREWDWDIPNPVSGRKLREPEGRARWISRSQSEALIRAAEVESNAPHLADFIRLALHTGCRKQELLGLEWARVDLAANLFYLEAQHTKTARRRSIPLNRSAKAVILNRARFRAKHCPGSPWVFSHKDGSRIQDVKRSFTTACERARIDDFRIHDLRHTCAAWLVSAGVPLTEVKALLGHTTVKMTERYAHLSPDNVRAAVAKLDGGHTLVTPGENLDRNELTLVR